MNIPTPTSPFAAMDLVDTLLRNAVRILYESSGGLDFPEYYVRSIAPEKMASQLVGLRHLEPPERRQEVAAYVSKLRAEVDLPPMSWDEIVCSAYRR
jgi:hypothetical protein